MTAIGLGVQDIRNEATLQDQLDALKWQHEQWLNIRGPTTLRALQYQQEKVRSEYLDAVELLSQFNLEDRQ